MAPLELTVAEKYQKDFNATVRRWSKGTRFAEIYELPTSCFYSYVYGPKWNSKLENSTADPQLANNLVTAIEAISRSLERYSRMQRLKEMHLFIQDFLRETINELLCNHRDPIFPVEWAFPEDDFCFEFPISEKNKVGINVMCPQVQILVIENIKIGFSSSMVGKCFPSEIILNTNESYFHSVHRLFRNIVHDSVCELTDKCKVYIPKDEEQDVVEWLKNEKEARENEIYARMDQDYDERDTKEQKELNARQEKMKRLRLGTLCNNHNVPDEIPYPEEPVREEIKSPEENPELITLSDNGNVEHNVEDNIDDFVDEDEIDMSNEDPAEVEIPPVENSREMETDFNGLNKILHDVEVDKRKRCSDSADPFPERIATKKRRSVGSMCSANTSASTSAHSSPVDQESDDALIEESNSHSSTQTEEAVQVSPRNENERPPPQPSSFPATSASSSTVEGDHSKSDEIVEKPSICFQLNSRLIQKTTIAAFRGEKPIDTNIKRKEVEKKTRERTPNPTSGHSKRMIPPPVAPKIETTLAYNSSRPLHFIVRKNKVLHRTWNEVTTKKQWKKMFMSKSEMSNVKLDLVERISSRLVSNRMALDRTKIERDAQRSFRKNTEIPIEKVNEFVKRHIVALFTISGCNEKIVIPEQWAVFDPKAKLFVSAGDKHADVGKTRCFLGGQLYELLQPSSKKKAGLSKSAKTILDDFKEASSKLVADLVRTVFDVRMDSQEHVSFYFNGKFDYRPPYKID
ncbi:unnamed protein product [Caenorhabditis sp. 36 PRJEB53466]|nr:unnamed protein product [Caenorhabditis sp. 36 PRJEB53466]